MSGLEETKQNSNQSRLAAGKLSADRLIAVPALHHGRGIDKRIKILGVWSPEN